MSELLPCPFCRSDDVNYWYEGQPARYMYVRCRDCHAIGPFIEADLSGSGMPSNDQSRVINAAITAWNTRNEWIPVSERLPDYETEVLVRGLGEKGSHYLFEFAKRRETKNSFLWEGRDYFEIWFKIIDWMPLPAPSGAQNEIKQ